METPAIVAMWAAAFAAVIGPVIGVVMANTFARHESRRTGAAGVFRRVMENSQNYRHAFLNQHRFRSQMESKGVMLNKLLETIEKTAPATDSVGRSIHAQVQALYQQGVSDVQQIEGRFAQAFNETRSMESLLNADKLSLGLLFDMQSERCGRAINHLIAMSEVFNLESLPSMEECQTRLNDRLQAITAEIRPLHDSLRRSDPLCTDV